MNRQSQDQILRNYFSFLVKKSTLPASEQQFLIEKYCSRFLFKLTEHLRLSGTVIPEKPSPRVLENIEKVFHETIASAGDIIKKLTDIESIFAAGKLDAVEYDFLQEIIQEQLVRLDSCFSEIILQTEHNLYTKQISAYLWTEFRRDLPHYSFLPEPSQDLLKAQLEQLWFEKEEPFCQTIDPLLKERLEILEELLTGQEDLGGKNLLLSKLASLDSFISAACLKYCHALGALRDACVNTFFNNFNKSIQIELESLLEKILNPQIVADLEYLIRELECFPPGTMYHTDGVMRRFENTYHSIFYTIEALSSENLKVLQRLKSEYAIAQKTAGAFESTLESLKPAMKSCGSYTALNFQAGHRQHNHHSRVNMKK